MTCRLLTIQNIGSEGLEIELMTENGVVKDAVGVVGVINKRGYISDEQRRYFDGCGKRKRLTKPMLREGEGYVEIEFKEAFDLINRRLKMVEADENLFLVSSSLTNEELYSAQKLARRAVGTDNINSVQYRNRAYLESVTRCNVSLCELSEAHAVVIYDREGVSPVVNDILSECGQGVIRRGVLGEEMFREFNRTILKESMYDKDIVESIPGFDAFKERICDKDDTTEFDEAVSGRAKALFEDRTIYVFNDESMDIGLLNEVINFLLLKGRLGQLYSGVLVVRSECNAEGVFDMGCMPELGVGRVKTGKTIKHDDMLKEGRIRNLFVFDNMNRELNDVPVEKVEFVVCQRPFVDDECDADLILPASLHYEIGGTFTNTCHNIQQFGAVVEDELEYNSLQQYAEMCRMFGVDHPQSSSDVFMEIITLLKRECVMLPFDSLIKNK